MGANDNARAGKFPVALSDGMDLGGRLPKLAATGVSQEVGGTVILKDLPLARTEESTYGRPRWILRCTQNDKG